MRTLADQLALEEEYRNRSVNRRRAEAIESMENNRAADVHSLRALSVRMHKPVKDVLHARIHSRGRGVAGVLMSSLRDLDIDILVQIGIGVMMNAACSSELVSMQTVWADIGKAVETERLVWAMQKVNPDFAYRMIRDADQQNRKSGKFTRNVFLYSAQRAGLDWEGYTTVEHMQIGRTISDCVVAATGLFEYLRNGFGGEVRSMYYLNPTEELQKYITDSIDRPHGTSYFPPCLVPPRDWTGMFDGGYFTEYYQVIGSMCSIRGMSAKHRRWIMDNLASDKAAEVRAAMNKAQNVPYRISKTSVELLRKALGTGTSVLGLPRSSPIPKPEFPFEHGVDTKAFNEKEQAIFDSWKSEAKAWYSLELQRKSQVYALVSKLQECTRFIDEEELYFPTFLDWRGRLYFRSTLNPQAADPIKACLEFAEGKVLGAEGLKWLKVHVANCAGYDKHSVDLKVQWVDENIESIRRFVENPLDTPAPEDSTAFTFYQAALALLEALALPNPEEYVCHVPVAMDATCSGLQHFSAMLLDEEGGYYTNLTDINEEQKQDIYMQVAKVAQEKLWGFCTDINIKEFWKGHAVTRSMAKRPVMTYVYGSTLTSTMDYVVEDLRNRDVPPIIEDGRVLYSLAKLSAPMAKALRAGVVGTVPKAAEAMSLLQKAVRSTEEPLRWITPVGMPVVNWAQKVEHKRIRILSLGQQLMLSVMNNTKRYNKRAAINSISPNFIHSMDSAHLCKTVLSTDCSILPIHDSFATHPSDVQSMHKAIRETFYNLYKDVDYIQELFNSNGVDMKSPSKGKLNLKAVLNSEYMFS